MKRAPVAANNKLPNMIKASTLITEEMPWETHSIPSTYDKVRVWG